MKYVFVDSMTKRKKEDNVISDLSTGKQRLLDYMGETYTTQVIDFENCVYLDMGEHDIEISGGKTIRSTFNIYVWGKKSGLQIVERHMEVKPNLQEVDAKLNDIRNRYSSRIDCNSPIQKALSNRN